ncbi:MAG: TAXI family TRAP transporter solute-binding subunit [Symploca sp. SIO2B6]|nr:TAXI family TRAP transporter solute-binding subunit [Symploca sp. SIO2B6]
MKSNGRTALLVNGRVALLALVGVGLAIAIASALTWMREVQQTYTVRLASGSSTGEYYKFAQAIAQVTQNHYPEINIEVVESPGSTQNMLDVQNRFVDMALVQSNTPVKLNVRAIAQLYPEMLHFIVNQEAGIETMADIEGKRVALMPKGSGSYSLFWPLTEHYGLGPTDFSSSLLPPSEATQALLNNEVDALFRIIGLGNQEMSQLLQTGQFKLISFDQVEALQLTQPYLQPTMIPKGAYDGKLPNPPQDFPTLAVSALLIAHAEVEVEVIRAITQVLYEHRNELIQLNPRAANIQPLEVSQDIGFPLHPGTLAYHNEDAPSFLVQYAELMGLALSIVILIGSGLWQFRRWLIGRQKNRADHYNLEILELISEVDHATTLEELQAIRQKLFSILKEVVIDLDIDRISPESFQSFTFPWEVAITTIRHQEMVVLNLADAQHPPRAATKAITKIHIPNGQGPKERDRV